jgi:hypothetical protein
LVPIFNLKDSIVEALTALGGFGTASEVRDYIKSKYGKDWKDIEQVMDDLCIESESSFFPPEYRELKKVGADRYSLKTAIVPELLETKASSQSEESSAVEGQTVVFSFREAEEILQSKGQLSIILKAASLTDLSSKDDHDKVQHFLHENLWDTEVSLFPVSAYKLDAFKEKTAIEIERSLIDAVHRSFFRCLWAYSKKHLDVLVLIVPTYKEPKFEHVKRDIQEFKEVLPYPVYLVGIAPFQL